MVDLELAEELDVAGPSADSALVDDDEVENSDPETHWHLANKSGEYTISSHAVMSGPRDARMDGKGPGG